MSARASGYIKALTMCPNGELISAREKLVAMVLADSHQDRARRFTFPSVDTIAEEARCDRRSCQRFLAALERKGVIRRLRPSNQGAGMHTFYFFPALDELPEGWQDAALFEFAHEKGRAAKGRAKGRQKGGSPPPLHNSTRAQEVTVTKATEANTIPLPPSQCEGDAARKEQPNDAGKTKTGAAALAAETAQRIQGFDASVATTPFRDRAGTPNHRGKRIDATSARPDVEPVIDAVMLGCGFTARRLRRAICAVLELEADKGILPATTSLAMIAAWKKYVAQDELLRFKWGPRAFFEEGHWRDARGWPWDQDALERQRLMREARVGSPDVYQVN